MDEKTAYWVEIAEYDLETARAMLETGRFLYVGFMCHQVAEKMLKAHFVSATGGTPPYLHNLRKLADGSGALDAMSDAQKDLLDVLEPLNVEARYPTDRQRLSAAMTREFSENLLRRVEGLCLWIKPKL